jgi:hypothetical protein
VAACSIKSISINYIYIYIYMYVCICVCICVYGGGGGANLSRVIFWDHVVGKDRYFRGIMVG